MTRQADSHRKTPLLEWIAGSLGLMLLIGMLSIIGYDALSGASRAPAVVVVKTGKVARAGDGFVVEFVATNLSGGTAAALAIEGQLIENDQVLETSSATIDYLPGHGSAEGGLFFQHAPEGGIIRARALGYQNP